LIYISFKIKKRKLQTAIAPIKEAQSAFFQAGHTRSLQERKKYLKAFDRSIKANESQIFEALTADLGKTAFESFTSEVMLVQKEIRMQLKHLKRWAAPQRVPGSWVNFPSRDYLLPEPYGQVLMISPWNYPFQLALTPLVGAVAAGNTVVLKPSELAPKTSTIVNHIISESFPKEWVTVLEGGVAEAQALLAQAWDYIFYTGSTHVGKIIAQAAAQNLTPTTLELGGKSPCIVHESAPLQTTAKRIVWGKFLNCGQTCIAPDYVLVPPQQKQALLAALQTEIRKAFGQEAANSKDYGRIINESHLNRLQGYLKNQKVVYGGQTETSTRFMEPTLVDSPALDSPIMKEEIFGPILPVLTYANRTELEQIIFGLDKPLAFYVFSKNNKFIRYCETRFSFGGGVVNDTLLHFTNDNLPFGGVGASGMGAYHGAFSFSTFTHVKPIVKKGFWFDLPQRYAPYPKLSNLLKWLLKKI